MERQGDEVHIETDEARGGSTPHILRYILVISLALAILAMSLIWITGAVSRDEYADPAAGPAASPAAVEEVTGGD